MALPPLQHRSIFEEFNQGDSSAARRYGGTGLGLAIAQHLTRLMGGQMGLNSQPGAGSTFWFQLPVEIAAVPVAVPLRGHESSPSKASPAGWSRLDYSCRVLVVEDHIVNQMVVRSMLELMGCSAEVAGGGHEGVQAALHKPFDLILMDCQMPDIDGYEATRQIRRWEAQQPGVRHIPIVALTAHAMQGDQEKCAAAGMDDYLSKPCSSQTLFGMLQRWTRAPA